MGNTFRIVNLLLTLLLLSITQSIQASQITYFEHIAPIFLKRCVSCHHPGGGAPIPFTTYESVRRRAKQIAIVTKSRYMPPWKPDLNCGEFAGIRRLTQNELDTIAAWAASGASPGRPKIVATAKSAELDSNWKLGKPDLVLQPKTAFNVPAEGPDSYASFLLADIPGFSDESTDRIWKNGIQGVEFKFGKTTFIRYAMLFVDTTRATRQLILEYRDKGFFPRSGPSLVSIGAFFEWTPGAAPRLLPKSTSIPVKQGGDLVLLVRFHPTGKREAVLPKIGIYLSHHPKPHSLISLPMGVGMIDIPAGEAQYKASTSLTLPVPITLTGCSPHAEHVCKEITAAAILPNGQREKLLCIKDWDADWQEAYRFLHPISLPAGTKIEVNCTYDNSAANSRNPFSPPRRMLSGMHHVNEMEGVWFHFISSSENDIQRLTFALEEKTMNDMNSGR